MGVKEDWQVYTNLGMIEGLQGNRNLELEYYFKALALKPDSTDLLNNIAAAYIEINELAKAEEYLNKILSVEPNFKDAQLNFNILNTLKKESRQ